MSDRAQESAKLVAALCAEEPSLSELAELFPASWATVCEELGELARQPHPQLISEKLSHAHGEWRAQSRAFSSLQQRFDAAAANDLATVLCRKLALDQFCRGLVRDAEGKRGIKDRLVFRLRILRQALSPRALPLAAHERTWRRLRNRPAAAAALHRAGCYAVFPAELVAKLLAWTTGRKVLEIGAGRGLLARYLAELGQDVVAVDDYSWQDRIPMGSHVRRMDGIKALIEYAPEVVVCCWPPPGNPFEKAIFGTASVQTYLAIGSRHPHASGNHHAYRKARGFTCVEDPELDALLLPREVESTVRIFTRKPKGSR